MSFQCFCLLLRNHSSSAQQWVTNSSWIYWPEDREVLNWVERPGLFFSVAVTLEASHSAGKKSEKYKRCKLNLTFLKIIIVRDTLPLILLKTPPYFKFTYPIFLAPFWSRSESLLSRLYEVWLYIWGMLLPRAASRLTQTLQYPQPLCWQVWYHLTSEHSLKAKWP